MRLPSPASNESWALALSGGADSTALLHRCCEAGFPVTALHFNHGFSDENGDEGEAFCRELCDTLGVPLIVGHCLTPWDGRLTKEVFARNHRMDFFVRVMRARKFTGLLVAHQMDDRAENLILRLARGCGLSGLTSFDEAGTVLGAGELKLWRPLLDETHADQVAWLQARKLTWVEDCSNEDVTIPRNAIRKLLVPRLKHFVAGANVSAKLLAEEDAFLAQLTAQAVQTQTPQRLTLAEGTPAVLIRRALRQWLPNLTHAWLHRLADLPLRQIVQVPGGFRIRRAAVATWENLGHCPDGRRAAVESATRD